MLFRSNPVPIRAVPWCPGALVFHYSSVGTQSLAQCPTLTLLPMSKFLFSFFVYLSLLFLRPGMGKSRSLTKPTSTTQSGLDLFNFVFIRLYRQGVHVFYTSFHMFSIMTLGEVLSP